VKRRKIVTQLDNVPLITCSPAQINQVFLNLINNACQATNDENGTITLHTAPTLSGVMIEISDNGKGIPPDVLPKIFDPFFTTKKVGEGTGLGLSIVQRIIKEHGGEIKVTSTVGVGTCFSIFLPRKHEPKVDKQLEAAAGQASANSASSDVPPAVSKAA
jgi:signal transduction histidine kinase